jgi:hypothetical protein
MTLCPIAMAIGCQKCAIVGACPLKGVIGDYRKPDETQKQDAGKIRPGGNQHH